MKVTVIEGNKAIDANGKKYEIESLGIIVPPSGIRKYKTDERFFQVACPVGTKHDFVQLENGKISLR